MPAKTFEQPDFASRDIKAPGAPSDESPDVLVYVDETESCKSSIPHAIAVASSFGGKVILVKVLETQENGSMPIDPVDWEIRKQTARTDLENLVKKYSMPECVVKIRTLEGNLIDQLCACASQKPQDIIAVSRNDSTEGLRSRHSMRHLVDFDIGSVLLIPSNVSASNPQKYKRIFVPLDGSPLAESAIPKAVAIAKAHDAEVLICHIMPDPGITVIGPLDKTAAALHKQVWLRNSQTGKDYLKRIASRLKDSKVPVKTVFVDLGDVRRSLLETADKHSANLIVIASHGQSAQSDVPSGHVASFVLDHSTIPVLMVRKQHRNVDAHTFSDVRSSGLRVPAKTNNG